MALDTDEDVEDEAAEALATSNDEGARRTMPTSLREQNRAIGNGSGSQHVKSEHGGNGAATTTRRVGSSQVGEEFSWVDSPRYLFRS